MPNPSFRTLIADTAPLADTCLDPECDEEPEADAPLPLCLAHIRLAFAYYLRHAEDDHSATGRDAYELDKTNGWVYFIRVGDLIKIGWTRTPKTRFRSLQPDAVLHYEPGTRLQEQQLHMAFVHLLVPERGREYFRAGSDLVAFINKLHSGS